jgi:Spy/CpxP family protein refolding chaperone
MHPNNRIKIKKIMKTKAIFPYLFIVLLSLASNEIIAQADMDDETYRFNRPCRYEQIPNLTDSQEAEIENLRITHYKATRDLQSDLEILRAEKRKLMLADNPDAKAIDTKIDEMNAIQSSLQKQRVAHHLAVRNLLTDSQKAHFDMYCGRQSYHNKPMHRGMRPDARRAEGRGMRDGSGRW